MDGVPGVLGDDMKRLIIAKGGKLTATAAPAPSPAAGAMAGAGDKNGKSSTTSGAAGSNKNKGGLLGAAASANSGDSTNSLDEFSSELFELSAGVFVEWYELECEKLDTKKKLYSVRKRDNMFFF